MEGKTFAELQAQFRSIWPTVTLRSIGDVERTVVVVHSISFGVPDVKAACDKVRAAGGKVTREPGPVKFGTTMIAFVEDPDGYKIELIERKPADTH